MPKEIRRFLRNYATVLTSVLMIVLAGVGTWWGLVPFGRHVWSMYEELQKTQKNIEVLNAKYTLLSSFSESDLRRGANDLLLAVPAKKEVATLMTTIQQAVTAQGLSVRALTIASPGSLATEAAKRQSKEEQEVGAGIITAGITVEGSLAALKGFLRTGQEVRRLLRMPNIEVTVREGNARANIAVHGYYSPLPTSIGSVTEKVTPLTQEQDELLEKISAYPVVFNQEEGVVFFPSKANPFSP